MRTTTTVVIGAGHCGLAMSRGLAERSIDHVVLERGEVAHSWRTQRWDSVRLLTPNWMTRLPGHAYTGDDPHGCLGMGRLLDTLDAWADRGRRRRSAGAVRADHGAGSRADDAADRRRGGRLGDRVPAGAVLPLRHRRARPTGPRRAQRRGDGTAAPGLYVMGLPFLRRRRSTLIDGAAADARELADHLVSHLSDAALRATIVAGRDPRRLAAELTETARLRALLPGGPIEVHGREDVAARFHGFFADFDTVRLVESAGEAVADRLLIHYRLDVTQGATRWVCTQTALCKVVDGRLAVIDMLCSGFREIENDDHLSTASGARRVG